MALNQRGSFEIDHWQARTYLLQMAANNPDCPWADLQFSGFQRCVDENCLKGFMVGVRPDGTEVTATITINSYSFVLAPDSYVEMMREALVDAKKYLDDRFYTNLRDIVNIVRKKYGCIAGG